MPSPKPSFALREALRSAERNPFMSFLSVAAVAAALAVAGAWMLLQANTQLLLAGFEQRVEVVAYLRTGLAPEAVSATASALAALPGVRSMELVSPDEAARALSRDPELKKYLEVLGRNPLPASVRLRMETEDPARLRILAEQSKALPGVDEVDYGREAVERLLKAFSVVRWLLSAVAGLLGAVALLVVANILKLTAHSRRAELSIMRLVGAPGWFVRLPFLLEGMLQGVLGGLLAAGGLYVLGQALAARALAELQVDLGSFMPQGIDLGFCLRLVGLGLALGFVGGLFAAGRNTRP
jgi:cell division transport system permease protein